jgi:6-phospho-3-hexuloisomerase
MTVTSGSPVSERLTTILRELEAIVGAVDAKQLEILVKAIIGAKRIFFSGQGRSGLAIRATAIRLMHVGCLVHVAGEPSTPAITKGDMLIAVSASSKTQTTLAHVEVAKRAGAKVALISAGRASSDPSDLLVVIPAGSAVPTVQHAGSLFEQSLLILGDAIARQVQQQLGVDEELMNERHANLQ